MNSGEKRTGEKKFCEKFKSYCRSQLLKKHINLIQLAVINAIQRLKLINVEKGNEVKKDIPTFIRMTH
jgi:hypothetical protein